MICTFFAGVARKTRIEPARLPEGNRNRPSSPTAVLAAPPDAGRRLIWINDGGTGRASALVQGSVVWGTGGRPPRAGLASSLDIEGVSERW